MSEQLSQDTLCKHTSWSSDEGPIVAPGRYSKVWHCDECGAVRHECWSQGCFEMGDLYRTENDMHLKTYRCVEHAHELGPEWLVAR